MQQYVRTKNGDVGCGLWNCTEIYTVLYCGAARVETVGSVPSTVVRGGVGGVGGC